MTLRWERQGPGAGAKRGPSHRRVTQHKGDSREAAAGADLRSPATRNCGYRPAVPLPLPLPTQARPPARSLAFLSPLSLRTGRPEPISRLRIFGTDQGWGRGSRWLRRGSWAASLVRRASLPSPLSPVSARRPAPSSGPARAVGQTLRRVGRCCCCCCCCARVAFGAGSSPEAGERGGQDPGPTWLKSASTSLSCRESRKVGAGSRNARGAPPLSQPAFPPGWYVGPRPPRPGRGAHLCWPSLAAKEIGFRLYCGTLSKSLAF